MDPADSNPARNRQPADNLDLLVGREFAIMGQVQGVGFRPFVYRLACSLGLRGRVWNEAAGVRILVVGAEQRLDRFREALITQRPALARIDSIAAADVQVPPGLSGGFEIVTSDRAGVPDQVTPDSATCADCLRELFDPHHRRYRHALINCTNCGPRYCIVRDMPYDRASTTMAPFPMCPACAAEFENPRDRRFHAQPTCCPNCGPRVRLISQDTPEQVDPIAAAAALLRRGGILAMKGLGGYHLAVDATNSAAVARLRERKRRDLKPFAVMAANIEVARSLADLSAAAVTSLQCPTAPIVLAIRRENDGLAPGVAPSVHRLGIMLPHTPLQHLLMANGFRTLVMTSANVSDEPLVTDDKEATTRLAGIADAWLTHDRPIQRAVDDSIVQDTPLGLVTIRRGRGMAPQPIKLPVPAPQTGLCLGGELKGAVALAIGDHAVLSQHLGDLSYFAAFERFRTTIEDALRLYRARPRWIACDPHPEYLSRQEARLMSRRLGVPQIEVQHHHAHLASVLAEHGLEGPAVGIICDGVGYGLDGTAWGGEILVGDLRSCQRRGRLRPIRLPGGDVAARCTGRCLAGWLDDAFGPPALDGALGRIAVPSDCERRFVTQMMASDINCPQSSGAGRLFDAAAALLGVCERNHFEAMSGMYLEALAHQAQPPSDPASAVSVATNAGLVEIDHRPLALRLIRGLEANEPIPFLARLFHEVLAAGFITAAERVAKEAGLNVIALSGGVFCNALFATLVHDGLVRRGFNVLTHRLVPPNDGGLAFGQAAVAAASLATETGD